MNKPWPAPTDALLPCQRALFDIPRDVCFLNAASWSPLPLASQEAGRIGVARKGQPWKLAPEFAPAQHQRARVAAAVAHGRAREMGARTLCWEVPHHVGDEVVEGLVQGTLLHAYRFERYKPRENSRRVNRLLVSAHHDMSEPVRLARILAEAQNRARDLGNTPANDLPPPALAAYAEELAGRHGLGFSALDEDAIRAAGMGAFAAVAQGSAQSARLIRLDYDGASGEGPLR